MVEVRCPNYISLWILLINPLKLGRDNKTILEEVKHLHTPSIISKIVCVCFFFNVKVIKSTLLLLLTIKHYIYLVAPPFTFHAEPAVYILVQIILHVMSGNTPSICKCICPTLYSTTVSLKSRQQVVMKHHCISFCLSEWFFTSSFIWNQWPYPYLP